GTAEHLLQVFDNLLSNAIKYTPDGGHIRICARETDGQVLIAVRDNGIGIPDGELENIFKDFYQLSDARNHHSSKYEFLGGGAGLGLSLCRSIVKAHLGDIWAESEGQYLGSTFFVRLPLNGTPEKAVRPMLEARRFERYQERQAV
ncbi:MAG: GHKL domain-containing protein, partial [Calditrichaeota bacterium]|nr:GHKL domain-containing protein [Calditrichota bacterium]